MDTPKQTQDTLWTLIVAPTVWALHFLLCYIVAAFECAPNVAIFEPIVVTRLVVAGLTVLALAIIAVVFRRALREWRGHDRGFTHDADTDLDRERFLEFSTLLLGALSFVSVIFVALPAFFSVDCR